MYNGCLIKVSKAIVDRYALNRSMQSADEGLVLCILLNNKEALVQNENGETEINPKVKSFLRGDFDHK